MAEFVKFVKDPEGKLLLALLHSICQRFPVEYRLKSEAVVSLSCPSPDDTHDPHTHLVTLFGFSLLEQAEIIVGGAHSQPRQKLHGLWTYREKMEHLEEFASRASRQKQKGTRLETNMDGDYININFQSTEAWLKLLHYCNQWKIGELVEPDWTISGDNIVGLFEGLAKETARGTIGCMAIYDRVIAQSKRAQLKRLWTIT